MPKIKLTDKVVDDAIAVRRMADIAREQWMFDTEVQGFAVRLSKGGKAFGVYQYWTPGSGRKGHPRKLQLGEIDPRPRAKGDKIEGGKLNVDAARKLARTASGKVAADEDPWHDEKTARDRVKAETFGDAWTLFTASWSDEDRYRKECKALVTKDALPALGSRPLAEITRRDIAPVVDAVTARSRSRAWELHKNLRQCFNWAIDQGLLEHSPMDRMKPPKAVAARERLLSAKEIGAFWRASGQLEFPWQQTFRLLLLTACRREEVGAMEWRELDRDVWSIPPERTKNNKRHIIDLPPLAVEIVNSVPRAHDLVFTSTGTTPPSGWGKPKKRLDDLMREDIGELEPFRLHDLRRTVVTTLNEEFDYSEELGERLLNHVKPGIMKVYNKATLREKRKEALLRWSNYVLKLGNSV